MSEHQDEQIPEQLMALIPEFLNNRYTELDSILKSVQQEDYEAIRKIAHDWKGYSRPYGFGKLEGYANQLREACINKKPEKIKEIIDEIKSYLVDKKSALDV